MSLITWLVEALSNYAIAWWRDPRAPEAPKGVSGSARFSHMLPWRHPCSPWSSPTRSPWANGTRQCLTVA